MIPSLQELQQIMFRIDEHRFVTLSEEMPRLADAPMHAARVAAGEPLHDAADGDLIALQDQVNGLRRPTIAMNPGVGTAQAGREQSLEQNVVFGLRKNGVMRVAMLDDIVRAACNMKPLTSRHPAISW